MPQLSPMMGVMVFALTNLSFIVVVLSIRGMLSAQNLKGSAGKALKGAFRGFS